MEAAELYTHTHTHTHTQLRHCLAFLLFVIIPYNSFALDACVEDDTVAIVLDPNITPSQYFPEGAHICSDSTGTWNFTTNGVKIYGSSACVSNNKHFDTNGQLWDGDVLVENDYTNGDHCFCRLIYPVVSKWVHHTTIVSTNYGTYCGIRRYGCDQVTCKYNCSWAIGQSSYTNFRKKLFSSIKQ